MNAPHPTATVTIVTDGPATTIANRIPFDHGKRLAFEVSYGALREVKAAEVSR